MVCTSSIHPPPPPDLHAPPLLTPQLVVLVLAGFVITWLPYTLVSLHATIVGAYELPVYMVAVVTLFAKLSGLTNPLCYILVSSRYR